MDGGVSLESEHEGIKTHTKLNLTPMHRPPSCVQISTHSDRQEVNGMFMLPGPVLCQSDQLHCNSGACIHLSPNTCFSNILIITVVGEMYCGAHDQEHKLQYVVHRIYPIDIVQLGCIAWT